MGTSRAIFRAMLKGDEIIVQPTVFDALSARLAEDFGFRALCLGGYQMGAHMMGIPEPLLCLEDVAACTRHAASAVQVPIMVDAATGFGDPLHVARTVRVLEDAGAASLFIEDQVFPKRAHYHKGVEHVVPIEEMVDKIRAAVRSRRDPDLVIVGRTDAMRTDGYDEGIRRALAFAEAGADMVMVFPNSEDEAQRAPRDLTGIPVIYTNSAGNRTGRPLLSTAELHELGYRLVVHALTLTIVAVRALRDALSELAQTGLASVDAQEAIAVRKLIEDTIGLEEAYALEEATVEGEVGP